MSDRPILITYLVHPGEGEELDEKLENICLEQSVELPRSVLPSRIEAEVVGQVLDVEADGEGCWRATVGWPADNIGGDISQFLNTLYGNISLQTGIRVVDVKWSSLPGGLFGGPAQGIGELRTRFGIHGRPLSCASLKPLGSDAEEIGGLCYEFAAGGIDLIKDDHGITNQKYAPFRDRVRHCVKAVERADRETGHRARYFAHITALAETAVERYRQAAELGADGVLICPHITGMETMHQIARMELPLPVMAHPAFSGGLTTAPRQGLSPDFLYGQLWRALGADFVVYPNSGGRFSFTREECLAINAAARDEKSGFRRSFPMTGGGMKRETLSGWVEAYGHDTVFLLGSNLYEHPEGIRAAAEEVSSLLRNAAE